MKITVITVNLNNKEGLKKTLQSVNEQSYSDVQHLVIDGASNDGSLDLLKEGVYKELKWISEKDRGIYDAMNKAIPLAEGDYCLYLNSGDTFASVDTLGSAVSSLGKHDIVYGDLITVDEKGLEEKHLSFEKAGVNEFMISTIWHPTAFFKKDLLLSSGGYKDSYRIAGDFEFFLRCILVLGASAMHLSQFIARFDLSGVSNNKDQKDLMEKERERAWTENFSPYMVTFFKRFVQMKRSPELRTGRLLSKFIPA